MVGVDISAVVAVAERLKTTYELYHNIRSRILLYYQYLQKIMYSYRPLLSCAIFNLPLCLVLCSVLGNESPGEMTPGRLELATGDSANITCRMNVQMIKADSASLYFVNGNDERVPPTDFAVVNETSAVLMLRNAPAQNQKYTCMSGIFAIDMSHVSVDTAPVPVTDFGCRGHDYMYMVCKFTPPKNMLRTLYNLSYTAHSPRRRRSHHENGTLFYQTIYPQSYMQPCKLEWQSPQRICNLTLNDENYRYNNEFFNFTLIGYNAIGSRTQSFMINHFDSVVPARLNLTLTQKSNDSALFTWSLTNNLVYKKKGLSYKVQVQPDGMEPINALDYEIRINAEQFGLQLRRLPYAYWWYRLTVRVKVQTAPDDPSMWSEPAEFRFQTEPCVPATPPATDVGSFYIDSTDTHVHLYWEQYPAYRENGANFSFVVTEVKRDDVVVAIQPSSIEGTTAIFEWDKRLSYEFDLKSRNALGDSPASSRIVVPAMPDPKRNEQQTPQWIRSVYDSEKQEYTLSWRAPTDVADLIDYTVFWCHTKREIRIGCQNNTLQFQHVSKDTLRFTQKHNPTLNLAVSANYANANSGMHWPMCRAQDKASELFVLQPELTAIAFDRVEIRWNTDCVYTSLLKGYNLTFCRVAFGDEAAPCLEPKQTREVSRTAKNHVLEDLLPYSTYRIVMYMYSELKVGKVSDAKFITTLEKEPSPPTHLKVHNITSNAAYISWMPPSKFNGLLRHYTVDYNGETEIVNCTETMSCSDDAASGAGTSTPVFYWLKNLSSYTDYKVYVRAYTVKLSGLSNDSHFKTLIDRPSNPQKIVHYHTNSTLVWQPPEMPSGRVEFYEVARTVWNKETKVQERISSVVGATSCTMQIPICINANYHYTLQVRAVNVAEIEREVFIANGTSVLTTESDPDAQYYLGNGDLSCMGTAMSAEKEAALLARYRDSHKYVLYKSVWQNGTETNCVETKESLISVLAVLSMVLALVVMATSYLIRKWWIKMSDINCQLPHDLTMAPAKSADGNGGGGGSFISDHKTVLYSSDSYQPLCSSTGSVWKSSTLPDIAAVTLRQQAELPAAGDPVAAGRTGTDAGPATVALSEVANMAHEERELEHQRLLSSGYNNETGYPHNGMTPCSLGKSSGYAGSNHFDDYVGADALVVPPTAPNHSDYMAMWLPIKENGVGATVAMPTVPPVTAEAVAATAPEIDAADTNVVWASDPPAMASMYGHTDNNYINRNKMFGWQQPQSPQRAANLNLAADGDIGIGGGGGGGYVPLHALQKYRADEESVPPTTGLGDDMLAKRALPIAQQGTIPAYLSLAKRDVDGGAISGYVT